MDVYRIFFLSRPFKLFCLAGKLLTPQNEKEKTEESRAGPPLSLYIDSRIFLAAACSMSCFASSLLPRSADTMI